MKRLTALVLAAAAFAVGAADVLAEPAASSGRRPRVVSRPAASSPAKPAAARPQAITAETYSVQLNIATHLQGTSLFRTSVDVTNNSDSDGVVAQLQYCYTFATVFQGCTAVQSLPPLFSRDDFHTDDIVQFLGATPGVLVPGADTASFGTLLVTFTNLPSREGWEGTVTARTYNPYDQANPSLGTVASAYLASLFFESAAYSLVGTVRDTIAAPTVAGALRTNIGITNTALVPNPVAPFYYPATVRLQFYDATQGSATNGQLVGTYNIPHPLAAGEVFQLNNVWATLGIPSNVQTCIAFADVVNPTGNERIEGFIAILDNGTRDNAYFDMKCSAGCGIPP